MCYRMIENNNTFLQIDYIDFEQIHFVLWVVGAAIIISIAKAPTNAKNVFVLLFDKNLPNVKSPIYMNWSNIVIILLNINKKK